jgi:hypothetical protein
MVGHSFPELSLKKILATNVTKAIRSLNEIPVGEGFDYMTFFNEEEGRAALPVGVVDKSYIEQVGSRYADKSAKPTPVKDQIFKESTLLVKGFHVETGSGSGYLIIKVDGAEERINVTIKASGRGKEASYHSTALTESEHFGTPVAVMGKLTRVDGVIKSIEVDLSE